MKHVIQELRRAALACDADQPDARLLERFVRGRDEAAFEALLRRHGPMVLGVCTRVLRSHVDAEDAFQATFLVLARKAGSVRRPGLLGNWLYGVAYRTALHARSAAARRRVKERAAARPEAVTVGPPADLLPELDRELNLLPEKYRAALVLCDLEGKTYREAAQALGCPEGTLAARLSRARTLLARRLTRRGLSLSGTVLAAVLTSEASAALLPAGLATSTLRAVTGQAVGRPAALAAGVMRALLLARLTTTTALLALLGAVGLGVGALAHGAARDQSAAAEAESPAMVVMPVGVLPADVPADPLPPGAVRRLGTLRFRHGFGNTEVAFAPGGKVLLTVSLGGVRFCDAVTGKEIPAAANLPRGNVTRAALSPDGSVLALGTADGEVLLCDRATGGKLRTLKGPAGVVLSLAFAPDGKHLVAAGRFDQHFHLWDAATGELRRRVPTDRTECLAFSPDGKLMATRLEQRALRVADVATGKTVRDFRHARQLVCVAFSPNGKTLAAGTDRGAVVLWDAVTGEEKGRLARPVHMVPSGPFARPAGGGMVPVYDPAVRAVAFAPDGKTLAAVSNVIRLWDLASGRERAPLEGAVCGSGRPAFSPDGKTLADGEGGVVRLWDVASGRRLRQFAGHESQVFHVWFSANGRVVVTESSGVDSSLRLWEAATGRPLGRVPDASSARLSPHGRLLVADAGGAVRLVDVVTARTLEQRPGWLQAGFAQAYSADGNLLANGEVGGRITLWDRRSAGVPRKLEGHRGHTHGLAFTPDGKGLISAGEDRTLRIWDTDTGKERRRRDVDSIPWALALARDGKTVATANNDNTLRVYDAATLQERSRSKEAGQGTLAVAYSPDGRLLASAGNQGVVRLWDAATGKELRTLRGHGGAVRSVAFSPDGSLLASAGDDTTALLWKVKEGGPPALPTRHPGGADVRACWEDLASADGFRACLAVRHLADVPDRAVPFLAKRLRPLAAAEPGVVRLVRDLGDPKFAVRDRAVRELQRLGDRAQPALRQALAGKPPLEVRRRVEQLLARLDEVAYPPERLRAVRAVTALEQAGTPAARAALHDLAHGGGEPRLTRAAREALDRLGKPATSVP